QVALYMQYHAARNARNAAASRAERIKTLPVPTVRALRLPHDISPPRADLHRFFTFAARLLRPRFPRPVTILDLGCGGGPCLQFFEPAGYRATALGVARRCTPAGSPGATG